MSIFKSYSGEIYMSILQAFSKQLKYSSHYNDLSKWHQKAPSRHELYFLMFILMQCHRFYTRINHCQKLILVTYTFELFLIKLKSKVDLMITQTHNHFDFYDITNSIL